MEQKILKYKKIYTIFLVLALIGFIDLIIIPILLKNFPGETPEGIGLIPLLLGSLLGNIGVTIGIWFTYLWFVWGLIAFSLNGSIKKLEKNLINNK